MTTLIKLLTSEGIADRRGQDLVEYALIAGFVAAAAVAAFPAITATGGRFSTVMSILGVALSQTANQ